MPIVYGLNRGYNEQVYYCNKFIHLFLAIVARVSTSTVRKIFSAD
jgi:hypothetical protein